MRGQINKYTAFVPRTLNATKNVGRSTMKSLQKILHNSIKRINNTRKQINSRAAKSIRALTRKSIRR